MEERKTEQQKQQQHVVWFTVMQEPPPLLIFSGRVLHSSQRSGSSNGHRSFLNLRCPKLPREKRIQEDREVEVDGTHSAA